MAVGTLHSSNEISALSVAAKRSCAPQWRSFMEALGGALPEITGDEMALRILAKTGAAIAKAQPLSACNSLKDLKAAINTGLESMDWGQVDIRETERALEFIVVGYPHFESVDARAAFLAKIKRAHPDCGGNTEEAASLSVAWRLIRRRFARRGITL